MINITIGDTPHDTKLTYNDKPLYGIVAVRYITYVSTDKWIMELTMSEPVIGRDGRPRVKKNKYQFPGDIDEILRITEIWERVSIEGEEDADS